MVERKEDILLRAAANGDLNDVQTCLGRGASLDARDDDGCTPLHLAAENGHEKVVELLLKSGASVNARNDFHMKPSNLAAGKGNRVLQLLREAERRAEKQQ